MTTPWWTEWNLNYFPDSDAYGPLFGGHSVQEALYNTFFTWMPAYIREINRQIGGNVLSIPQRYRDRPDWAPSLGDIDSPRLLVIVEGTEDVPNRETDNVRSTWKAEVSVHVYGTTDWEETQALCYTYGACIAAVGVQQGGLGGIAEATKWTGTRYVEGEHTGLRTNGVVLVEFEIMLPSTFDPYGGPPSAIAAPSDISTLPSLLVTPAQPDVETTNVTVENTEE